MGVFPGGKAVVVVVMMGVFVEGAGGGRGGGRGSFRRLVLVLAVEEVVHDEEISRR